jgi:hypothetical protein
MFDSSGESPLYNLIEVKCHGVAVANARVAHAVAAAEIH